MIRTTDIHSLTDFQRNAKTYIQHVTHTKHPIAITVNGQAEVVVQDARLYQEMIDELEQTRLLEAIREGEADVAAGRVVPAEQAFADLRREFGISG